MGQDVRRTHLVPIVHGVQLVNSSVSSVTNIEPVGMRVEVADVQSILFQKGCGKFRCIVLRLLIRRIIRRGHNAFNGNGSAISITTAISGVPAAQAVGQILPCTYIIHIVMDTHILHVVIDGCPCVLFRRGRSACYGDPVCVVNSHTNDFPRHGNRGHINVVGIVFGE